ncbi:MAG: hypothetical protein LUH05_03010 [Candidatus Gastranaerophilales bacterium]|nr:hypothetical protein [Candidatus Gastranaerophilales bacterium]
MTKTLSEELCEICGIKPRYGLYVDFGDFDPNYRLVTSERKYRLIADYRYCTPEDELRSLEPKYLPDFTKSENFVKLLKIYAQHTIIISLFESDNSTVIDCLLYSVMAAVKFNDDECKALKDAIKQADWNYE